MNPDLESERSSLESSQFLSIPPRSWRHLEDGDSMRVARVWKGGTLRQLNERLPSLERGNNGWQFCVEPFHQLCATSIANSDPPDRRPRVQDAVHAKSSS